MLTKAVAALRDTEKVIDKLKDSGKSGSELGQVPTKASELNRAATGLKTQLSSSDAPVGPCRKQSNVVQDNSAEGKLEALATQANIVGTINTSSGSETPADQVQGKLTNLKTKLGEAASAIEACSDLTGPTSKIYST